MFEHHNLMNFNGRYFVRREFVLENGKDVTGISISFENFTISSRFIQHTSSTQKKHHNFLFYLH